MAMNLRKKSNGCLTIYDLNSAAIDKFCKEAEEYGEVKVALDAAEVVAACVRRLPFASDNRMSLLPLFQKESMLLPSIPQPAAVLCP